MKSLSIKEKLAHHEKLNAYVEIINKYILKDSGIYLRNVAYGIPIEGELTYFDFPYTQDVDKLNETLARDPEFKDVDKGIYDKFHERQKTLLPDDQGSHIIWSYELEYAKDGPISATILDSTNNIGIEKTDIWLQKFLPVMIATGEPKFDFLLPVHLGIKDSDQTKNIMMLCKRLGDAESANKIEQNLTDEHIIICSLSASSPQILSENVNFIYGDVFYLLESYFLSPVLRKFIESIQRGQLRTAIISILVDSYAHNISAHSMVALEEWFRNRSELLEKKIYKNESSKTLVFKHTEISPPVLAEISNQAAEYYALLGLGDQTNTNQYLSLADIIRLKGFDIESLFVGTSVLLNETEGKKREERGQIAEPLLDQNGELQMEKHIFPVPVDYAMWQFFRFMKGKAAFWSGVTRDLPFGGEHISLYDLLYKYLAENPLYLGTIVHSEGINKLKIKVGIDRNFIADQPEEITFYDFLQIDTSLIKQETNIESLEFNSSNPFNTFELANESKDSKTAINYSNYGFIQFGRDFQLLRETFNYKSKKAFLPGGLVGIHSFLTIIENTIRNVKHYKHHIIQDQHTTNDFDDLVSNGVTLLITFEQMDLFGKKVTNHSKGEQGYKNRLYRTGVALGHRLSSELKTIPEESLIKKLYGEITDEELGKPKLGGTSQDKICSAMLLNNKFMSVETLETPRDYFYYPWVQPKQLSYQELINGKTSNPEFSNEIYNSLNQNRAGEYSKNEKLDREKSYYDTTKKFSDSSWKEDYVFKFFNLWVSDEVVKLSGNMESDQLIRQSENYARFKFGVLAEGELAAYLKQLTDNKEERQIFRLIESNEQDIDEKIAYRLWNQSIFNTGNQLQMRIFDTPIGDIPAESSFGFSRESLISFPPMIAPREIETGDMIFAHGNNPDISKILNYRSHGILSEKFTVDGEIRRGVLAEQRMEFIETVLTQVTIWDDRIFERVKKDNSEHLSKYAKGLRLHFNPEKEYANGLLWREDPLEDIHNIFIIHLSFIEYLKGKHQEKRPEKHQENEQEKEQAEKNILDWFIERYIKKESYLDFRKLTICVISGRGNAEWFSKINDKYIPLIIYRPVETILDAVEDALVYGDDFQLKYNICKSVIGS